MVGQDALTKLALKLEAAWEKRARKLCREPHKSLAELEDNLQSFLRDEYASAILRNLRHKGQPTLSLVGAHYRSRLSVRGRVTALAVDEKALQTRLEKFVRPGQLKANFPWAFWHAVFLEVYFKLFKKPYTMNEWVLERLRCQYDAVAVDFSWRDPANVQNSGSPQACGNQKDGRGFRCLGFTVPEEEAKFLMPDFVLKCFYRAVTNAALSEAPEGTNGGAAAGSGADQSSDEPEWFDRLRRAANRAWLELEREHVPETCARRAECAALKLYESRKTGRRWLPEDFGARGGATETKAVEDLRKPVTVLQAMLVYCGLYGDLYVTLPFWLQQPDVPGCSLTFMYRKNEGASQAGGSAPQDVAGLCALAGELRQLGKEVFSGIMDFAQKKLSELQGRFPKKNPPGGVLRPENADIKNIGLNQAWKKPPRNVQLMYLLSLTMNLCGIRHEGRELDFSLVLGNSHHLLHNFTIEHEFLRPRVLREGAMLQLGDDWLDLLVSVSLIKGNYAFLEDPQVALFLGYPGSPAQVSHLVRLPPVSARAARRRAALIDATRRARDLVGAVAYGRGRAELVYKGRVVAAYSGPGSGWKRAERGSFDEFWGKLKDKIQLLAAGGKKRSFGIQFGILREAIKEISDTPGCGATLVIAKRAGLASLRKQAMQLTEVFDCVEGWSLDELSAERFTQLAMEDGAVLIDTTDWRVSGRWQLPSVDFRKTGPTATPTARQRSWAVAWKSSGRFYWADWHKTLKWGTRHIAALSSSMLLREQGLVIVISADGPVHVFQNGKGVENLTYLE